MWGSLLALGTAGVGGKPRLLAAGARRGEPLEGANPVLWVWMLEGALEALGWQQSCTPPPWGQQVPAGVLRAPRS